MKNTQTKKVSDKTGHIEDLPVGRTLTKDELSVVIVDAVHDVRAAIYETLDHMIAAAIDQIRTMLEGQTLPAEFTEDMEGQFLGVRKKTIIDLVGKDTEELKTLLSGPQRYSIESEFLDIEDLQKKVVRSYYPKAFTKWTAEEDATLTDLYSQGLSWKDISERMQRNANALKIRAEKLGIASNTGARTRY